MQRQNLIAWRKAGFSWTVSHLALSCGRWRGLWPKMELGPSGENRDCFRPWRCCESQLPAGSVAMLKRAGKMGISERSKISAMSSEGIFRVNRPHMGFASNVVPGKKVLLDSRRHYLELRYIGQGRGMIRSTPASRGVIWI